MPQLAPDNFYKGFWLKKQTRMVLIAAFLSLLVLGGTKYWYHSQTAQLDQHDGTKPVAFASTVREDVRRRPAARLIWQNVGTGEALYPGEAIKTSNKSEVRIQFVDGHRYIDLDPDSLVVISSNDNEISLDLMDGSIFVGGEKDAGGPTLTLNSEKGKVDLSHATASLSKSATGVDVQILKGKATTDKGVEIKNQMIDTIKILAPKADQATVVNPDNAEPIQFTWQGMPEKSIVGLWLGSSRRDLKKVAQTNAPGVNLIEKRISTGKHFYKLVATDPNNPGVHIESQVHRLEVIAKYAPSPVFPANNATLVMNKPLNSINFKWHKPEEAKNVVIEIAKDAAFKEKVTKKEFNNEDDVTEMLALGEYFWRLSTNYEGVDKVMTSRAFHFSISGKPKVNLKIVWQPDQEKETQYFIDQAKLNMAWTVDLKSEVKKWKVHYWPSQDGRDPAAASEKIIDTTKMAALTDITQIGMYNAIVEAYNENDVLLATSEVKTFEVMPRPLIPAPIFLPETGNLKTDNQGNLKLKWTKLSDAKDYQVILKDKEGKEMKRARYAGVSTWLQNLNPGQYQVDIVATDIHGRESQHGTPRNLIVPETSGLKAPKLKKVQVN